jgi:hypothetical protein
MAYCPSGSYFKSSQGVHLVTRSFSYDSDFSLYNAIGNGTLTDALRVVNVAKIIGVPKAVIGEHPPGPLNEDTLLEIWLKREEYR